MKWNHLYFIQSLASFMITFTSNSLFPRLTQSVWDVTQMTVSRKTPIKLCGRSCSMRRDPAREPVLELVREWEPVLRSGPSCSCAHVKVLRSPQLRRCRMPGRLRSGSVLEVSSTCACLRRVDCAGATSETVMAWSMKLAQRTASSMCSSSERSTVLMLLTSSCTSGVKLQEDCSKKRATSSFVSL